MGGNAKNARWRMNPRGHVARHEVENQPFDIPIVGTEEHHAVIALVLGQLFKHQRVGTRDLCVMLKN